MNMKKINTLFLFVIFVSGCATYKFHHGKAPYDKGYVASRDDYDILEYTLGKDNSVPSNVALAKGRFKRRHHLVEHYYKKMGYIENHFKQAFWDPPIMFLKFISGTFRLPFVAISDYKYEHNPKYKEKVKRIEQEKDAKEEARINKMKGQLNNYIQRDLASEPYQTRLAKDEEIKPQKAASEGQKTLAMEAQPQKEISKEEPAKVENPPLEKVEPKEAEVKEGELKQIEQGPLGAERPSQETDSAVKGREQQQELQLEELSVGKTGMKKAESWPRAVIIARPLKGYAPLTVHFYGSKSYSPGTKIIAYSWDFGDGDTSTKANPVNTYYSGSFEPKQFTVTLAVTDNKGNAAAASTAIKVLNK